jgi:hypothetical protein
MKRTLLLCLSVIGGQTACDREFDPFEKVNSVSINISFDEAGLTELLTLTNGVLKDSVKRGRTNTYRMDFGGGSDNNTLLVDRLTPSRVVDFFINDSLLQSSANIARGKHRVGVQGISVGACHGSLTIKDSYEHSATIPYEFTVFHNLPPVCVMGVIPVKDLSPYEVMVDLSASYDADAKQGGAIAMYDYRVGSYYRLTTTKLAIYHILPDTGRYELRCRVRDNDGAWSDYAVQTITVTED